MPKESDMIIEKNLAEMRRAKDFVKAHSILNLEKSFEISK